MCLALGVLLGSGWDSAIAQQLNTGAADPATVQAARVHDLLQQGRTYHRAALRSDVPAQEIEQLLAALKRYPTNEDLVNG